MPCCQLFMLTPQVSLRDETISSPAQYSARVWDARGSITAFARLLVVERSKALGANNALTSLASLLIGMVSCTLAFQQFIPFAPKAYALRDRYPVFVLFRYLVVGCLCPHPGFPRGTRLYHHPPTVKSGRASGARAPNYSLCWSSK